MRSLSCLFSSRTTGFASPAGQTSVGTIATGRNVPALAAVVLLAGCVTRTVYVPHGTPVRLRETIRAAKVWVKDADGEAVKGEVDLHEGWYALPVPEEKK